MNDSPAALPDRLPWLPDEPRSRRTGALAIMLSGAVSIAVLAAGLSYSPWPIKIGGADDKRKSTSAKLEAPSATPREHGPEVYSNLQIEPAPPPVAALTAPTLPVAAPPIDAAPRPMPAQIAPVQKTPAESRSAPVTVAAKSTPAATKSAGKDCSLATTRAAIAVCRNPGLAKLDGEHGALYNQSWQSADPAKRMLLLRARQRMTGHLNKCPTDACLNGIYVAAMRELKGIGSAKVVASSAPASKPSINCRSASRPGELAVCRDPELAALERHQTLLYNQSWGFADAAKRARLLRSRERLAARRDQCGTERCTKSVYLAAMSEVTEIMTKD